MIQSRPYLLEQVKGVDFDFGGLVIFIITVGVFLWFMYKFIFDSGRSSEVTFDKTRVQLVTPTPNINYLVDQAINTLQTEATTTPYPTYTPYPTVPVLVVTATPEYEVKEFLYSYYYPPLGGANCRDYDEDNDTCLSVTASGQPWQDWLNKGLACPVEYPLWTIFRVEDPPALRGDWVCIDRGGLVTGRYLDFLQPVQVLPWNETVKAQVIYP